MGGVPAWADLENRKKSKRTLSDSKYANAILIRVSVIPYSAC